MHFIGNTKTTRSRNVCVYHVLSLRGCLMKWRFIEVLTISFFITCLLGNLVSFIEQKQKDLRYLQWLHPAPQFYCTQSGNESYTMRHLSGWGPSFKVLWNLSFSVQDFSIVSHKGSLSWGDMKCVCICLSDLQFLLQCRPLSLQKHTALLASCATYHQPRGRLKFFELIIHRKFANTFFFFFWQFAIKLLIQLSFIYSTYAN